MREISVIISTYNQPKWLEKVLIGYACQCFSDFDIVIADDGSTQETKEVIERFSSNSELNIQHVWQEDEGFRKTLILNKAIKVSKSPYLIFTDGDCIPRYDFVQKHFQLRKQNSFLSGGYFKLPLSISEIISKSDIESQACFEKSWLLDQGLKPNFKINKLNAHGIKEILLNKFTTTKATFDGMNASAWREHILAVNGFDTRMEYGGEDRELGERLMNYGIKPLQIRYSAICLHLDHKRSYVNTASIEANKAIRKKTKQTKSKWTDFGLEEVN
ncbi:MAG: glycosyltransferase family 2 protein [Bacteroidota bacterium]